MIFYGWTLYISRVILTVSVLLAFGGHGSAQIAPTSASDDGQQILVKPPLGSEQSVADSEHYKPNCTKPKQHDEADLCQQLRMAKAAEDAVWWARAQAVIGVVGFVGVLASLYFTGWAAVTASRQVRLSRQSVIDTDRAFVYVSEGLMGCVVDAKTHKVQAWKTGVRWKNSGTTPTRNLRLFIALAIREDELPAEFDFPPKPVADVNLMIAPGGTIDSDELGISLEDVDAIVAGLKHLYVWGWAEYDDVFEATPRHRTEFCFRWSIGGNVRSTDRFSSRYNIYSRHNGADEECEFPIVTASAKNPK